MAVTPPHISIPVIDTGTISKLISQARQGQAQACQEIWEYYRARILAFACDRLRTTSTTVADEEDVALEVFLSVFCKLRSGNYPQVNSRDALWRLLRTVAANKASTQRRDLCRQKRGGGVAPKGNVEQCTGGEDPAQVAADKDALEHFLSVLPTDELRLICILRAEGFTSGEIAERTGLTRSTVSRRFAEAAECWKRAVK